MITVYTAYAVLCLATQSGPTLPARLLCPWGETK